MQPCQKHLHEELERRRLRNSAYSLRAFARDLGVSVTALSDYLGGRRQLSRSNLERIFESLKLSPLQKLEFLEENKAKRNLGKGEIESRLLEEDTFRLLSEWYYLAILSLARLQDNRGEPEWISRRLGIALTEAKRALERLERLGLIEIRRGRMSRTTAPLTTSRDIPSAAIRKYHLENLRKAAESLERDPVEVREFSSITFPADPRKLKAAKDLLMKTKRKVAELIDDEKGGEVYTLAFQLFPVTRIQGGQE